MIMTYQSYSLPRGAAAAHGLVHMPRAFRRAALIKGMEGLLLRHRLLAWALCFVGAPLAVLGGVVLFTFAAVLPVTMLMGW